jgi:hypothetical protein
VEDEKRMPHAFWSARNKLQSWVEYELGDVLGHGEMLAPELVKLAERIEQHDKTK